MEQAAAHFVYNLLYLRSSMSRSYKLGLQVQRYRKSKKDICLLICWGLNGRVRVYKLGKMCTSKLHSAWGSRTPLSRPGQLSSTAEGCVVLGAAVSCTRRLLSASSADTSVSGLPEADSHLSWTHVSRPARLVSWLLLRSRRKSAGQALSLPTCSDRNSWLCSGKFGHAANWQYTVVLRAALANMAITDSKFSPTGPQRSHKQVLYVRQLSQSLQLQHTVEPGAASAEVHSR